jgi:hypothetical protein
LSLRRAALRCAALRSSRKAAAGAASGNVCFVGGETPDPARGDNFREVRYHRSYVLLHGDGRPCPRTAGHGGGGINSIVVGRAASSQTLAFFPVTLFSTSVRELDQ